MGGMFGGGGKKGGGAPPPDFSKAAMTGQSSPFGSVNWSRNPDGTANMNTQFGAGLQPAWEGVQSGMAKGAGFDPTQASQQAFDRVYGAYQSRLDPMWAQREGSFNASMANQGIDPGQEAFSNASRDFNVGRNDAYNQAIGQAVGLGQQEQAQARQNAMLPFMQGGAMAGMLPKGNPNMPFQAAQSQYEAAQNQASAQQAGKSGLLSGLGGTAGAIFGGPLGGMAGSAAGNLFSGKGGGGGYSANDLGNGYDPNLGGYNF